MSAVFALNTSEAGPSNGHKAGCKKEVPVDILTIQINTVHYVSRTGMQALNAEKNKAHQTLLTFFNAHYPGAKLFVTGSTFNRFDQNTSDLDITVELEEPPTNPFAIYEKCTEVYGKMCLELANVIGLRGVRTGKCPLIRLQNKALKFDIELNFSGSTAVRNSFLFRLVADFDRRVPKLACVLKKWAREKNLMDSFNGLLSTYGLLNLLVYYLQRKPVPVLPYFFAMIPDLATREIAELCLVCDANELRKKWRDSSEMVMPFTLADLLIEFFQFYKDFDFGANVISIRSRGAPHVSTFKKGVACRCEHLRCEKSGITIEEPFGRYSIHPMCEQRSNAGKLFNAACNQAFDALSESRNLHSIGIYY